ncbi:SCO family protein [Sphingomonas sp. RB3P16]|uniref:SCO family protein n=1 Tax=Parasphingomonas frigoris TaxID=3096163 RepID=UPI002FC64EBB
MITPEFNLIDHDGNLVTERSYRGRYMLVYFGFTHCRIVCPRALARLSQSIKQLEGQAPEIVGLYVTVDPERDTPDVMRRFLEPWPGFTGLTGSASQIDAAKRAFKVFAGNRVSEDDGYRVPHSAFTHFLDPVGRHIDHWSDALDVSEIVGRLRTEIER